MDLGDVLAGGHMPRPDHPDFWKLSEIILGLKAKMEDAGDDLAEQERVWEAEYSKIIDVDSVSYHAIQAAIQTGPYQTVGDLKRVLNDPSERAAFVRAVQTFLDGFLMGAKFVKQQGGQ